MSTGAPSARSLVLTPASEIEPRPVVWAWEDDGEGRIPAGTVSLFAGREGTGKSSFLIWLTARLTTGSLPGTLFGHAKAVIYVAVEDSWAHTIVPRLIAAGADLDLVYRAEVRFLEEENVCLSLPADNAMLEQAIIEHNVVLVALDPLISAISGSLDTHHNREVRSALDPLASLADRTGAVIGGIAHFNKSSGTDPSSLITGSGAFKDVARSIFAFAVDEEDGSQVITQVKNSYGKSGLPSLAYRISEATVETRTGDAKVCRFVLDGESDRSVRDILSYSSGGGERDEMSRAKDFLLTALAPGPRATREVEEEALQAHSIAKRTLVRARGELNIVPVKRGKAWFISLPQHAGDLREQADSPSPAETPNSTKDAKDGIVGNLAKDAKAASPGTVGIVGILDSPKSAESERLEIEPPTLTARAEKPDQDRGPCGRCGAECLRYGPSATSSWCDACRNVPDAPSNPEPEIPDSSAPPAAPYAWFDDLTAGRKTGLVNQ